MAALLPATHRSMLVHAATKLDMTCTILSDGAITVVKHGAVEKVFMLCRYPLNNASSSAVCADKTATAAMMAHHGIPHVKHHLFVNPSRSRLEDATLWETIFAYADRKKERVVCKPKDGSAGDGVVLTTDKKALETAVKALFAREKDVTLSPYLPIKHEYRVLTIHNRAEIIFKKIRPSITGDGHHPISYLIQQFLATLSSAEARKVSETLDPALATSEEVLPAGNKVDLTWKDDLGPGSSCELIGGIICEELGLPLKEETSHLIAIASRTAAALGIALAAVDIVEIADEARPEKKWRVMEVNSAPSMAPLAKGGDHHKAVTICFMEKMLRATFDGHSS